MRALAVIAGLTRNLIHSLAWERCRSTSGMTFCMTSGMTSGMTFCMTFCITGT